MPKSLIFVAAGSGVGKTGFSIFLLDAIARQQPGSQTLFFSIEMEYSQIWMRHLGVCAGKPFDQLSEDECMSAVTKLSAVPMRLYDTAICRDVSDLDFILNTARLRAMEKPISVIVVDYLGLVECKQKFERHELQQSFIVKELSKLAQQLNCTVILLSQINRGAATRADGDRCPWPHDAADSSGGHKSSNYWLGVDRPELYRDDPLYSNQFVIKCRKNRFGNLFELILAFNGGTFAEVPFGWFKNPKPLPKNAQEALFSHRGHDFVNN
jgi:replicative DNA helicase